jgi:ureidoacrylate peracid hydrolase
VRDAGGKVYWIRNTHDADCLVSWSHYHQYLFRPERRAKRNQSMTEGALGHQLYAGLDVHTEDEVVLKKRFSALAQGSSDLESRLRSGGIDTVIVAGLLTNVCCDSTARDAMMLNFRAIMASDANAANSDEEHSASLLAFYRSFGDVMETTELIDCLGRGAGRVRAAS